MNITQSRGVLTLLPVVSIVATLKGGKHQFPQMYKQIEKIRQKKVRGPGWYHFENASLLIYPYERDHDGTSAFWARGTKDELFWFYVWDESNNLIPHLLREVLDMAPVVVSYLDIPS